MEEKQLWAESGLILEIVLGRAPVCTQSWTGSRSMVRGSEQF